MTYTIRFDRHAMELNTQNKFDSMIRKVINVAVDNQDSLIAINDLYALYDGFFYKRELMDYHDNLKSGGRDDDAEHIMNLINFTSKELAELC